MYLVLLENPPFFSPLELGSFAVLAPVDGIAHGGHFAGILMRDRSLACRDAVVFGGGGSGGGD